MSKVKKLHDKAMKLTQKAILARHEGNWEESERLAKEAFEYESQAAELVPYDNNSEPTRSILYRSAASLAIQCKEFSSAQHLIFKGLSGYPPPEVEDELKRLYEQLNFEEHLYSRDIVLRDDEIEFSVLGNAVTYGLVYFDEFIKRIQTVWNIIDRTVQRKMLKEYQRSGPVKKKFKPFVPLLSPARAGSFAVTIKLGVPDERRYQLPLFDVKAPEVIDDVIVGIELINAYDEEGLRKLIKHEGYFQNFKSLVRDMAPDGEKINFVGLASPRKSVALTLPREKISLVPLEIEKDPEDEKMSVRGVLDYATSRKQDIIGLTDDDKEAHMIKIQEGMDDLVRSYYGQLVKISGIKKGKFIHLIDIKPVDD